MRGVLGRFTKLLGSSDTRPSCETEYTVGCPHARCRSEMFVRTLQRHLILEQCEKFGGLMSFKIEASSKGNLGTTETKMRPSRPCKCGTRGHVVGHAEDSLRAARRPISPQTRPAISGQSPSAAQPSGPICQLGMPGSRNTPRRPHNSFPIQTTVTSISRQDGSRAEFTMSATASSTASTMEWRFPPQIAFCLRCVYCCRTWPGFCKASKSPAISTKVRAPALKMSVESLTMMAPFSRPRCLLPRVL